MINQLTPAGENSTMVSAMESNILKATMRRAAEKCGYGLLHYYSTAGNEGHEKKMRHMMKDLLYSKIEDEEYLCESIYEEANMHLAAAMKHGYTAADLAELRHSIDHYRVLKKNKRQAKGNKKKLDEIMQNIEIWGRRSA